MSSRTLAVESDQMWQFKKLISNNPIYSELEAIIKHWLIWFSLGSQDIKLRYRRSAIGPLWITISMSINIYTMGFLYGHLFKVKLAQYFPYLASGIIGWSLISMLIVESSNIFIESENYIKNRESFTSLFIMRLILRNIIIFLHNMLAYLPIIFIFTGLGFKSLLMIPGLLLIAVNTVFWGSVIAAIGTRFRDFSQIVNSVVQVVFFLTPIMWMPTLLPSKYQWIVQFNPFNQFLNLIRKPMMDQFIGLYNLLIVLLLTLIGFFLYVVVMKKCKDRIVFWL